MPDPSQSACGAGDRLLRRPDVDLSEYARPELGATTHLSRRLQDHLHRHPGDEERWRQLADSYRDMAEIWSDWAGEHSDYALPVAAGLAWCRPHRRVVEIAAGSGQATAVLVEAGLRVLATDINREMVQRIRPGLGLARAVADARSLPVAPGSLGLLVGLNAVLVPAEVDRVLRADGELLWCSSFGLETPLYLSPADVLEKLGDGWQAEWGVAGRGEWVLARRIDITDMEQSPA